MMRAILLASATATTLKGRRANRAISHWGALSLPRDVPQDRSRAKDQQGAERWIAHFRYPAQPLLAAARMGPRCQSQPGGEVTAGLEPVGIWNQAP